MDLEWEFSIPLIRYQRVSKIKGWAGEKKKKHSKGGQILHQPEEFGNTCLVGSILNDSQLEISAELGPKFDVVLWVHLLEHVQCFPHQLLLDHLDQLVLLQHLTGDIEGKVVRVHLGRVKG